MGKDATAAVQAVIDAAARTAPRLAYIPSGLYQVDGTVNIPAGMTVHMDGRDTRLYRPGVLSNNPALPDRPIFNVQGDHVTIDGGKFFGDDGNEAGSGFVGEGFDYQSTCIDIDHDLGDRKYLTFRNIWFENYYGFSIQCSVNDYYTVVQNCKMLYNANGLNIGYSDCDLSHNQFINAEGIEAFAHKAKIHDNQILGAFNGGISFYGRGTDCSHNHIDMSLATNQAGVGVTGISLSGAYDARIVGNTIISPRYAGIALFLSPGGVINTTTPSNCVIANNNIYSDRTANSVNSPTAIALANSILIHVVANGITGFPTDTDSFQIGVSLIACENCNVTANGFDGMINAAIYGDSGSQHLNITDNQMINSGGRGIYLANADECLVKHNHSVDAATEDFHLAAASTNCRYTPDENVFAVTNILGTTVP